MQILTASAAATFLSSQGVEPLKDLPQVMRGFDHAAPMYQHDFWPGDILYQFIRHASALNPTPGRGSWYGIAGVTRQGVAIIDGLAGRTLYKFAVTLPFAALEGTAARLPIDWRHEIGGIGGATQVYVPRRFAGHIRSLGPVEGW